MIERTIKQVVLNRIQNNPITLISGARQVGKTTLCLEIAKELNFSYVSLDVPKNKLDANNDPELFLAMHPFPLIIDEVQYAPKLFEYLEAIVNEQKRKTGNNYGMYVLTGSQTYNLMQGVTQSLAGRVTLIDMLPLSLSEIHHQEEVPFSVDIDRLQKRTENYQLSIDEIYNTLVKGFYPELHQNRKKDSADFYNDYLNSYIERDVSQLIQLGDKTKFLQFMAVLASLTGEELVYDTISKAIGVSVKTVQSWVSILVAGNIVHLLPAYNEHSTLKSVVKRPKLYFYDTGLACFLSGFDNATFLQKTIFKGRFIETFIVNEIIKSYKNNGKQAHFYYYRDTEKREIDLVILAQGQLQFVECKAGIDYSIKDIAAFQYLKSKTAMDVNRGCIICLTPQIYALGEGNIALPISAI